MSTTSITCAARNIANTTRFKEVQELAELLSELTRVGHNSNCTVTTSRVRQENARQPAGNSRNREMSTTSITDAAKNIANRTRHRDVQELAELLGELTRVCDDLGRSITELKDWVQRPYSEARR